MRELIDGLKDEDVEKSLQTVKELFFDGSKVDDKEMKRATLEGLVNRLSPGAAIVSASTKSSPSPQTPFLAEILDSHIAYFRLGALTKDTLAQFDAALASFAQKEIDAVILDLRGLLDAGDYEAAAEFARGMPVAGIASHAVGVFVAVDERDRLIETADPDATQDRPENLFAVDAHLGANVVEERGPQEEPAVAAGDAHAAAVDHELRA